MNAAPTNGVPDIEPEARGSAAADTGADGPEKAGTEQDRPEEDGPEEDGLEEVRRGPLRRCIVTGAVQPKDRMIRFVIGPAGAVVADLEGRLPGRGVWVTAERAVLERAIAKKAFARAARGPVHLPPDLLDQLAARIGRRCLDLIGLARRAGQVVAGFEQVREALSQNRINRAGPVGLLIEARDGATDGRQKLRALARTLPVIEAFDADELGAALGRDRIVHAAVARGRLADQVMSETARLAGLAPTKTDRD